MKSIPLMSPDGKIRLYYCSKCGKYKKEKEAADKCCLCITCGKEIDHEYSNLDCRADDSITIELSTLVLNITLSLMVEYPIIFESPHIATSPIKVAKSEKYVVIE